MSLAHHLAGIAVVATVLATPGVASGDARVVAEPNNRYVNPQVSIDPGQRVTLLNRDVARHSVTATRTADGRPLFDTGLLSRGQEREAAGAARLGPGTYGFFCTLHPSMRGLLTVNGNPAGDTTAPALVARLRPTTLRQVLRTGRIPVAVVLDEPARVTLTARRSGVTLARRTSRLFPGESRVALRLTAAGRRALRPRSRATLTLRARAVDAAGNATRATSRRTLRR